MRLAALLTVACVAVSSRAASGQSFFFCYEPNQTKATASPVLGMVAYDVLYLAGGAGAPNVLRVRTASLPSAIVRHELRTLATPLPTTLLGRDATTDQVFPQSSVPVQTMTNLGSPSQYLAWYGFGKSEEVYVDFAITGGGRSFGPAMDLVTSAVLERSLGAVPAGPHALRARIVPGSPTAHDLELFVFDAAHDALPYGANDESALSSEGPFLAFDMPPGVYHIAVTDREGATHLPPDPRDLRTSAPVLDFAGALVCSSPTTYFSVEVLVEDASGAVLASAIATKYLAYEALWFRVEVGTGQTLAAYCAGDGSAGTCGCLGASPARSGMGCVNSTGRGATVMATDHVAGAGGAWRVTFEDLPAQTLALGFVGLQAAAPAQVLGGSSCIAPGAARTAATQADAAGTAVLATFQPGALGFMAGQTLFWQGVYRDAAAPAGCQVNFTSGYSFVVR